MLFLQEKGRLAPFFKKAAHYDYMDIREGFVKDYMEMIYESAGIRYTGSSAPFDAAFRKWIDKMPLVQH